MWVPMPNSSSAAILVASISEVADDDDMRTDDTRSLGTATTGGPGLTSSFVVWALWIAVAAATWATNARTPVGLLYAVSDSGTRAGAGRVLVLLGWPVALAAVALVTVALDRVLAARTSPAARRTAIGSAVTAVLLCATIGLPGALDAKHLNAKPINALAAVGVAIAFGLSVWALYATGRGDGPRRTRSDLIWLLLFIALLAAALPWLLANLGFYAGDVPGLREVFMSRQIRPEQGYPHLAAVHLGNHDGLDGLLLALTAVVLMRELAGMRRLRTPLAAYLSLLSAYGFVVAAADWWGEQVVKRGWAAETIPSPIRPSLSPVWACIVIGGVLIWRFEIHALRTQRTSPGRR